MIAVWCAFGAASLTGPGLWRHLLQTWQPARMMAAALVLLAAGTLLPLLHPGSVSLFASAVLFGTSMWNIPSSVTNLANRAQPKPAWGSAVGTTAPARPFIVGRFAITLFLVTSSQMRAWWRRDV